MSPRGYLAVDAGGSRTRAVVQPPVGEAQLLELPSVNPSATGAAADATLGELFARVRVLLGAHPAAGWLASAAVDPHQPVAELDRVRRLGRQTGFTAPLVVSNDVVPLLLGVPALAGRGVVVVCGTGAGFLGGDGSGRIGRAGGCEYLGSDEGGAVDLGLRGLHAAVRALDGRGAPSRLVDELSEFAGRSVPELARLLAAEPHPKQPLARLAPVVCRTWLVGDEVAGEVVHAAVAELVLGVRAVCDQLGLAEGFAVAVTGGVVQGCPPLYGELSRRLVDELAAGSVDLVMDTAAVVLEALTRVWGPDGVPVLPAGLGNRHAWLVAT